MTAGNQGGYQQHQTVSRKTGKRPQKPALAKKILDNSLECQVAQMRNLAQFTGDNGKVPLSHYMDTTAAKRRLPLYLFDMSQRGDISAAGAGSMFRCFLNDPNGQVGWESTSFIGATPGTADYTWPYILYQSQGGTAQSMLENVVLEKVTVKLNLFGQTNRPTDFFIALVSFKDEVYAPVPDDNTSAVAIAPLPGKHNDLWQTYCRKLVGNPIGEYGGWGKNRRALHIIKEQKYSIAPTSTTETDGDPHCITVNWTHYINKMVDYKKQKASYATTDDGAIGAANVNQDVITTTTDATYRTPSAKDRVYLMVSSTSWTPNSGAGPETVNSASMASFDFNIKSTFKFMP